MVKEILPLGARNKNTGEYVFAKIANKKDKYVCFDCHKALVLCQGEIRKPYFRHKIDDNNQPCYRYTNPSESQIHKDAQLLLKKLLESGVNITFTRSCVTCKNNEEFEIPEITELTKIQVEYRFNFEDCLKIADVAYIDNDEIICLFEIYNTHKTLSENRPEPWFEIDAETLIKNASNITFNMLTIPCIRAEECDDCIQKKCYFSSKIRKYIRYKLTGEKKCNWNYKYRRCDCDYTYDCSFTFNAGDSYGYLENKKILELFQDKFYGYHAVIQTYNGTGAVYIISKKAYNKYDYWEEDYWVEDYGYLCELKLPYLYKINIGMWYDYKGCIIEDIIKACKNLYSVKNEKIRKIKNTINNIDKEKHHVKNKTKNDDHDDADVYRMMRYEKQEDKFKESLKNELIFIENDVEYIKGNNIITVTHQLTNIKIRRSLVNNKTYINGKWQSNLYINAILNWYYSKDGSFL